MKRVALAIALVGFAQAGIPAQQGAAVAPVSQAVAVDEMFARWTTVTPGCAVGVAIGGKPVLIKAYGMADLERSVKNTPETVFEAGSLSKQFTAMAVQLLAADGKLKLDDPVRKYIPELPEYQWPVTIRHMLSHTSGLRDWGSVASIAGWPRTTREYTHAHVLEIASKQKSLNFEPGTKWSYSNTGFNLAAIIVSRVSGMPFAEFSKQRIFAPLGMTQTQWRDDHTRLVKGRAIAYSMQNGTYHIEMPFENVHGNGGLLTTVGDLLIWNEHLVAPKIGSAKLIEEMSTVGRFNDGTPLSYGLGFFVEDHRGVHNVYHSGSTAGYRAHLNRFPAAHTSVAVLCNGSNGDATRAANTVSDVFLGDRLKPAPAPRPTTAQPPAMTPPPSAAQLEALAGTYWSDEAETALIAAVDQGSLVLRRRPDAVIRLTAIGPDKFRGSIGTVTFMRNASGAVDSLSVNQDRVWDLRFARK
jgi:CubicO group peptidase (beta-lactamase class C family)